MQKQILNYGVNTMISVLISVLITVVLLALSAWFMLSGKMSVGMERVILNVIRILSCLAGGFLCGRRNEKRGFLWGMLVGVMYYGLLILLKGMTGSDIQQTPMSMISTVLCCVGSGMLGGMLS